VHFPEAEETFVEGVGAVGGEEGGEEKQMETVTCIQFTRRCVCFVDTFSGRCTYYFVNRGVGNSTS
jgi:hypothetical protein